MAWLMAWPKKGGMCRTRHTCWFCHSVCLEVTFGPYLCDIDWYRMFSDSLCTLTPFKCIGVNADLTPRFDHPKESGKEYKALSFVLQMGLVKKPRFLRDYIISYYIGGHEEAILRVYIDQTGGFHEMYQGVNLLLQVLGWLVDGSLVGGLLWKSRGTRWSRVTEKHGATIEISGFCVEKKYPSSSK